MATAKAVKKSSELLSYEEQYFAQKGFTEAKVKKLRPGAIVEIKYRDAPNARAVLLDKFDGRDSLHLFTGSISHWHASYAQIVAYHGQITI
jgi:hypothetical protein